VDDVLYDRKHLDELRRWALPTRFLAFDDADLGDEATDARTPEPPDWNLSRGAGA